MGTHIPGRYDQGRIGPIWLNFNQSDALKVFNRVLRF